MVCQYPACIHGLLQLLVNYDKNNGKTEKEDEHRGSKTDKTLPPAHKQKLSMSA